MNFKTAETYCYIQKLQKKRKIKMEFENNQKNQLQIPNQGGDGKSEDSKEVNKQGSMMKIEGEEGMDFKQGKF